MKIFKIIFLAIILSCNTNQGKENMIIGNEKSDILKPDYSANDLQKEDLLNTEILETFVDSLNIGEKRKCKVELIKFRVYEDNFIIIKFYIKGRNAINEPETWLKTNIYCYETNAMGEFDPNISDFNNDNFNDITFISGEAARGANEVRRLFIYDNKNHGLISIQNSQDFPNMRYNNELNCIDSYIVTGGTSTHFASIKKDSLIEFASVHIDNNNRMVYEVDKFGRVKLLRKDTFIENENSYMRYKNYKPLKENRE